MSWGTEFKHNIFIRGKHFNSILEVEDKIDDNDNLIIKAAQELSMLVSANPKDIIPEEWREDSIMFLRQKVDDLMETVLDTKREQVYLYMLKDFLEENPEVKFKDINV